CSSRSRHMRSKRDWSSDVCSSDLHHERITMSFAELPPLLIQPGVIIFGLLVITAGILLTMRRLLWMNEALPTDLFMTECEVNARSEERRVGEGGRATRGRGDANAA